jgi:hypothetical protein
MEGCVGCKLTEEFMNVYISSKKGSLLINRYKPHQWIYMSSLREAINGHKKNYKPPRPHIQTWSISVT